METIEKNEYKRCNKDIYEMVPYFENTVLLGDSLAESILDFRLLRKNNVVAKRGRCIDMINGDLLIVYSLQPKKVFMQFGKNDMDHFHGDEKRFVEIYKQQIKKLNDHDVQQIYVNSIIPMRKDVEEKIGVETFGRFNQALRDMCKELQIPYIDNNHLMDWTYDEFEYDGIHPKYPYYQKWLHNIIQCADLTK